jgi:imidazolonepropionase-like amidohydrolase
MTPTQTLETATVNGADLLGMVDSLGAPRPGYLADIAGVEGDPLADIDVVIGKVRWGDEGWGSGGGQDQVVKRVD